MKIHRTNTSNARLFRDISQYWLQLLSQRLDAERMKIRFISTIMLSIVMYTNDTPAAETQKFEMTLCDVFEVSETDSWNVVVDRYLMLRFADVKITPKHGYNFNMKLFFKADTTDLSQFDTPQKIEQSVKKSTEGYLPYIVEKQIMLNPVPLPQSYGYYTVITDAKWADVRNIPEGEYKYMTRGMYRTSEDTALGFSIMSNDVTTDEYKGLLSYVYSFINSASNQPIKPPGNASRPSPLTSCFPQEMKDD